MKEYGWPAYEHEVQAILARRQTQFRRVVKPQPTGVPLSGIHCDWLEHDIPQYGICGENRVWVSPYGGPGDRLWVRETWAEVELDDVQGDVIFYKATDAAREISPGITLGKWRPSVHMPRWASRITLEVTAVRVERIQRINLDQHDEVLKEGWPWGREWPNRNPVHDFAELWDSINAKRGFGFDTNPWVWVVEFKRITGDD